MSNIELRDAWITHAGPKTDAGEQIIDIPSNIFEALDLTEGDELLWTMLPNNLGFTVTKVEKNGNL